MPYPLDPGIWPSEDIYPEGGAPALYYDATFTASLVSRQPRPLGAPTLTEVDRLVFDTLSYTDELNRPGSAMLSCPIQALTDLAKARLVDLGNNPSEVWVYRNSDLVWAGGIETVAVDGQGVQLGCTGLAGYLFRMGLTVDLDFEQIDQFDIAAALVDHHQSLLYGHFGITTGAAGESGVLRDRTYLRDELNNVGERLTELAAVDNGFDWYVDPDSRLLRLDYPQRGSDKTGSVFFDERNIDDANVSISVAPEDLVTDLSATGTWADSVGTNSVQYVARSIPGLRALFGRSWAGQNFSSVSQSETMEGHADAWLLPRGRAMFQPGVTLVPRLGADVRDFEPGDTIQYSYDAGLGRQTGDYRISKMTVDIAAGGAQRIKVEFV